MTQARSMGVGAKRAWLAGVVLASTAGVAGAQGVRLQRDPKSPLTVKERWVHALPNDAAHGALVTEFDDANSDGVADVAVLSWSHGKAREVRLEVLDGLTGAPLVSQRVAWPEPENLPISLLTLPRSSGCKTACLLVLAAPQLAFRDPWSGSWSIGDLSQRWDMEVRALHLTLDGRTTAGALPSDLMIPRYAQLARRAHSNGQERAVLMGARKREGSSTGPSNVVLELDSNHALWTSAGGLGDADSRRVDAPVLPFGGLRSPDPAFVVTRQMDSFPEMSTRVRAGVLSSAELASFGWESNLIAGCEYLQDAVLLRRTGKPFRAVVAFDNREFGRDAARSSTVFVDLESGRVESRERVLFGHECIDLAPAPDVDGDGEDELLLLCHLERLLLSVIRPDGSGSNVNFWLGDALGSPEHATLAVGNLRAGVAPIWAAVRPCKDSAAPATGPASVICVDLQRATAR